MKTAKKRLSGSSRQEGRTRANADGMVTRYRVQGSPLSPKAKKQLKALASATDETIDYSDIPPLTEGFWKNAIDNPYFRPVKKQVTLRLDSDVVAWAKHKGRGYQTRINAALRKAMLAELRPEPKQAAHRKAS